MKSLKKIAAVALAGVMALGVFSACGETSSLTDKLNTELKADFVYDISACHVAGNLYENQEMVKQAEEDFKDDIDDLDCVTTKGDVPSRCVVDTGADDYQKYLGATQKYYRRINSAAKLDSSESVISWGLLSTGVKTDDVKVDNYVSVLAEDIGSTIKTGTFGFFTYEVDDIAYIAYVVY